jgi:RES domain-containing protein
VANFAEGRYNREGTGPTQYLSLHPMTPWAELLRNEDRRTRDRAVMMRYPLWAIKVELTEDPLELNFDSAGQYGLSPDDLVSDDRSACQAFAEGLRSTTGPSAFTAPSAALPGTSNLVILEPAVVTSYDSRPVGPEDFPASMTSQNGRCPEGLWGLVHFRGVYVDQAALRAWRQNSVFEFEEPLVTRESLAA